MARRRIPHRPDWQLSSERTSRTRLTAVGVIEHRTAGPKPVVQIPASERDKIVRLATEAGPLETGGGCYSLRAGSREKITIESIAGPGRSFTRRLSSIEFDPDELANARRGWCGLWHTHPRCGLELSLRDLECFQQIRETAWRPSFVALIAAPADEARAMRDPWAAWQTPRLRAWIVGRGYYRDATLDVITGRTASARLGDRMMLATKTFSIRVDGQTEHIVAGRDRVIEGHEIHLARPDAFKALPPPPAIRAAGLGDFLGHMLRTETR